MILTAASSLYGAVASWRRGWYARQPGRARTLRQPVVSVGNLTAGGSGKTPLVAHIARLLLAHGERPAILTRGYARRSPRDGVTVVSDRSGVRAGLDVAGDEPLMLARALPGVPVLVGADRFFSGRLAEEQFEATVHLLDDGFQHLALARDIDLLLVDAHDLGDHVIPAGRLREPLAAAAAADAVLVTAESRSDEHAATGTPASVGLELRVPVAFSVIRTVGPPPADLRGVPVLAVAAVARPERLFADLAATGWSVAGALAFRDHHAFSARDLGRIAAQARGLGAASIVTTDKDAVRFEACDVGSLALRPVALTVAIEPRAAFEEWLLERLRASHRSCRTGHAPAPRRTRSATAADRPAHPLPAVARQTLIRHRLEYVAVRTVIGFVRVMPSRLVDACGSLLGLVSYTLDRAHRRIAQRNVAAAFPARSAAERRQIVRGAFTHFGRLLFELLKFSTLSPEAMLARVEFEGEERVRSAYAHGNGVLFVTGHFGFWELQAMVHAIKLQPMAVMARALDNPALNQLLERIRTRTGNSVIYRQETMRRVLRQLHAGGGVGILIDQHIQSRDAIYVDFFNRPAATTSAVAALALRTGARVVPLFALPLGGGRYRMVYEHPIEPPPRDSADPIHEFTQRCTDVLEMYVRRHPELWMWMHRRWRDNGSLGDAERNLFPSVEPG
ncbi:MAG: tetraacyldisaccharide 4'-kinase [Luteitalea sp.]|nr:tetraacyldisaccharide 4'-kinase [Luteitalea sp.]